MSERKFEIVKIIVGFALVAIVGPIVSKAFTHFEAKEHERARSRERALVLHDHLIESGANRVFWARRILAEVSRTDTDSSVELPYKEYNQSVAKWTATISSGLKTIENTYPEKIWLEFKRLNSDLGKLNEIVRRQIADLEKNGVAGDQKDNTDFAVNLSERVIGLSYQMQGYINSVEFQN